MIDPTPITLARAQRLAQALANTIKAPVSVIAEGERYFIRDSADLDCYGAGDAVVATYEPDPPQQSGLCWCITWHEQGNENDCPDCRYIELNGAEPDPPPPPDDNPDIDNTPATEGPSPLRRPQAVTLQSQVIEQTMQRNRICADPDCQGPHYTFQCPHIRAALFAPLDDYTECASCGDLYSCNSADLPPHICAACRENDEPAIAVYDTSEMVRLWAASRTLLATKLARLTGPQLACQALDFAAWLNEETQANLPALSVLHIWEQFIADGGDRGAALERAAA